VPLADPGEVEYPDQLGAVVHMEGQQAPPGAEYGPAVCRVIARWHDDCVPGLFYQVYDSFQQRIESVASRPLSWTRA
jgi:hypothetical protein